jgi:SAM-dependent methyltransferase
MGKIMGKHLGGHCNITHLDQGAIDWAKTEFNVKSMLDVGCGPGGMTKLAYESGLDSFGIDGDPQVQTTWFDKDRFMLHDFTLGPAPVEKTYDLCWSVEFVEHVHAEYISNFVAAFQKCKVLFMTHAVPGQGGYHHVNEQPEEYWLEQIGNYGFSFSREYTNKLREVTTMNIPRTRFAPYVKLTGLVFINESL